MKTYSQRIKLAISFTITATLHDHCNGQPGFDRDKNNGPGRNQEKHYPGRDRDRGHDFFQYSKYLPEGRVINVKQLFCFVFFCLLKSPPKWLSWPGRVQKRQIPAEIPALQGSRLSPDCNSSVYSFCVEVFRDNSRYTQRKSSKGPISQFFASFIWSHMRLLVK